MMPIQGLVPSQVIDNDQLVSIFKCSPQGGMRRSRSTDTLVIVSNHLKSIYEDRWVDDVLHYTGMGRTGDQSFSETQNKTLFESDSNGVEIHYFEVFKEQEYTYIGRMVLADAPYMEDQPDENGETRKVCVFPLKLVTGALPVIPSQLAKQIQETKAKAISKLSDEELLKRVSQSRNAPGKRQVSAPQFDRCPYVVEIAKRRAKGRCQLCSKPAPFLTGKGEPYLEVHHIKWLSEGGLDTLDNDVALCPNCHKKMHVLNQRADVEVLKNTVAHP